MGRAVVDPRGRPVGVCTDVRCWVGQGPIDMAPELTVAGLLVSPHHVGSLLGYERGRTKGPWLLAALVRRLHRGIVLIPWDDVVEVPAAHDRAITVRSGGHPLE
ncbi:MAG: hypothetical protein U0R23_12165 [Candidatus Nanopelagicales bacterium]